MKASEAVKILSEFPDEEIAIVWWRKQHAEIKLGHINKKIWNKACDIFGQFVITAQEIGLHDALLIAKDETHD